METGMRDGRPGGWVRREARGFFFRPVAVITLVTGMCLHLIGLLLGRDLLLERVLTPRVDSVLAVAMTYAGVTGWMAWRRALLPTRLHRALYLAICGYLTVSIPLHVQTLVTGRIDHVVRAFPEGYGALILPVMAVMTLFLARLRFRLPPADPHRASPGSTSPIARMEGSDGDAG